ncbi:uncharacterized protein PGTG_10985 [Puccinia graminis f. sp. tritici CRL 75-36-700-3]|uniref:Uncharacterized protein n=1 Tax=Puccinia graminis f. sp. tritici (strain CRL 75-36-700-3 / race SCCL) TaxID=418459 RepID=E3KN20_PUCGT|nr:uncharacterized protein PGTG_10985 [Puccinia graminis f. sp. tritici CRL 75-36-700-3]EFP85656.2 hypothetical protein PGTG_10985 [Puccinia graminis f. sp. tritici CRL 75-36-700-3]
MIEDQEIACGSENVMYETHELDKIDLDEIEWDDRSDLDINAATHQFHPEQLVTSEAIPEESVQQPEPDFDLKNYSADDVNRWASTLSAEEFKHLRIMGPDARTESFQHNKFHYQPDNINNNDFDQQQLHPQDNNFGSNLYNHFDEHTSQMEENLDGLETVDANSGFDDGGFDDGGFDNGGFGDGGFGNGSFDNGGFDDGGFDDGDGFSDDDGFDDGNGFDYY